MKKILISLMSLGMTVAAMAASQSLFDSDASATSSVIFGPARGGGQTRVKSILAKSGHAAAEVKLFARTGSRAAPTANAPNGATVISVANTGNIFTTNDLIAYVHADGTVDYTTASANSATTVTLAAGISSAGASGDYIYELSQQGTLSIGTTALNLSGDMIFVTPVDSPLRVLNSGTNDNFLTVTVDK